MWGGVGCQSINREVSKALKTVVFLNTNCRRPRVDLHVGPNVDTFGGARGGRGCDFTVSLKHKQLSDGMPPVFVTDNIWDAQMRKIGSLY